jgi:hypothetical protein
MRGQSVLDVLEEDDLFISYRLKDFLGVRKVKAMVLEICSSLGFASRKSHIENVYTYRIFVKRILESSLPRVSIASRVHLHVVRDLLSIGSRKTGYEDYNVP